MLEIIRDEQGNIKGVIEYYIVNSDGTMNDKGEYCWVNECEISPQYRNNGGIKKFISAIIIKYPQLKFGYFKRHKYDDRVKMFSRNQWLRRLNRR